MKTIIIHHLQERWHRGMNRYGTSFEEQLEKVYNHLSENYYDNVVVTNFEAGFGLEESQMVLSEFNPVVHDYMYGWERCEVESWGDMKEGIDFCDGGNHSEVVLIYDWMRDLKGEVYLCGAFDGECIEDMEIALTSINKDLKRIENLII